MQPRHHARRVPLLPSAYATTLVAVTARRQHRMPAANATELRSPAHRSQCGHAARGAGVRPATANVPQRAKACAGHEHAPAHVVLSADTEPHHRSCRAPSRGGLWGANQAAVCEWIWAHTGGSDRGPPAGAIVTMDGTTT